MHTEINFAYYLYLFISFMRYQISDVHIKALANNFSHLIWKVWFSLQCEKKGGNKNYSWVNVIFTKWPLLQIVSNLFDTKRNLLCLSSYINYSFSNRKFVRSDPNAPIKTLIPSVNTHTWFNTKMHRRILQWFKKCILM